MALTFEWDPDKAQANLVKHGIGFLEAATVLGDPLSLTISDQDHLEGEQRFVSVGMSDRLHLLVVAHTEWGERIRIISARRATRREQRAYEQEA
jgi:uncharacterized DUF497 family protein